MSGNFLIIGVNKQKPIREISPLKLKQMRERDLGYAFSEAILNPVPSSSEADRALSGVKNKLEENLSSDTLVNDLIHSATDPGNLSLMYSGKF